MSEKRRGLVADQLEQVDRFDPYDSLQKHKIDNLYDTVEFTLDDTKTGLPKHVVKWIDDWFTEQSILDKAEAEGLPSPLR